MQKNLVVSFIMLTFAYVIIKERVMKKSFAELVFGLLVWSVIIFACAIDFDMFWDWCRIELCLVGVSYGWYKLCGLQYLFERDDERV